MEVSIRTVFVLPLFNVDNVVRFFPSHLILVFGGAGTGLGIAKHEISQRMTNVRNQKMSKYSVKE